MIINFWQVDAFTSTIFKGNPAAVFILKEPLTDALMQNIAIEMNLSETAFILLKPKQNPYLRWFTPMGEIDLCGHATLASAHIYFAEVAKNTKTITFYTKFVGPLKVQKNNDSLSMDFPLRPGEKINIESIPEFVLPSLSSERPIYAAKSRDLMLVYASADTITTMRPNFNALLDYQDFIIVTAQSNNPQYDFISRFFCAADGILEDPVTGSAHCTLAPYWSKQLAKTHLFAYQDSKRGGELKLELKNNRLQITGCAITVSNGTMRV